LYLGHGVHSINVDASIRMGGVCGGGSLVLVLMLSLLMLIIG
jgi:hypothetical protein